MKIIEGMKRLRVIEKRMTTNRGNITRYSSMVSTEKPYFKDSTAQRKEVKSLAQANSNLMDEYLKLKLQVEHTNLETPVEIGGREYKISELLMLRRKLAKQMMSTFEAMNDEAGEKRLRMITGLRGEGERPHVERFYDETEKNKQRNKWMNLYDNIDARLEVINATTDLV